MSFKELIHVTEVTKAVGIELLIVFYYEPFLNVHGINRDDPSFISNIGNLYLLYFLINPVRGLSVFIYHFKGQVLSVIDFSLLFLFVFHFTNFLCDFIICFLLCAWGFDCSTFSVSYSRSLDH